MAAKFLLVSLLLLQFAVTAFSAAQPRRPNIRGNRKTKYERGGPAGGIPKPGSKPQVEFGGVDNHHAPKGPDRAGRKWCIAKSGLRKQQLKIDFDQLCKEPGIDCRPTGGAGLCYTESHWSKTSFALNAKYVKTRICNHGGRAELTNIDPSWGKCIMPGLKS